MGLTCRHGTILRACFSSVYTNLIVNSHYSLLTIDYCTGVCFMTPNYMMPKIGKKLNDAVFRLAMLPNFLNDAEFNFLYVCDVRFG